MSDIHSRLTDYREDLVIATRGGSLIDGKEILTADLKTTGYNMRHNEFKTEFNLNNNLANTELNILSENNLLVHNKTQKNIGVMFDRTKRTKEEKVCCTPWGSSTPTLPTSAL